MVKEYTFEGETVERVIESFAGDYWIITDDIGSHPYGYACLASCRQFAEWGYINRDNITGANVWDVPKNAWSYTGPDQIDISEK